MVTMVQKVVYSNLYSQAITHPFRIWRGFTLFWTGRSSIQKWSKTWQKIRVFSVVQNIFSKQLCNRLTQGLPSCTNFGTGWTNETTISTCFDTICVCTMHTFLDVKLSESTTDDDDPFRELRGSRGKFTCIPVAWTHPKTRYSHAFLTLPSCQSYVSYWVWTHFSENINLVSSVLDNINQYQYQYQDCEIIQCVSIWHLSYTIKLPIFSPIFVSLYVSWQTGKLRDIPLNTNDGKQFISPHPFWAKF